MKKYAEATFLDYNMNLKTHITLYYSTFINKYKPINV